MGFEQRRHNAISIPGGLYNERLVLLPLLLLPLLLLLTIITRK